MNRHWTVRLKDVADIDRSGIAPEEIEDGTRYVGLEHIESGGASVKSARVDGSDLASTKFRFTEDHILYGKLRPYLAKIVAPDFAGVCSTDILPIRPGKQIDKRFLLHFLRLPENVAWASGRATGVNLPRLSPSELADLSIPLPPLDEQRRIAAILDKADTLRQKRKRAIALLDSLTQSIFLEMFGDPISNAQRFPLQSLGSIATKFSDGPFGSHLKSDHYVSDGVRVIRLQNIGVGEFLKEDVAYISAEHFSELAKHECLPGDVLIGTLGDPNLRACIQPAWLSRALNKADCIQMRVDANQALPTYVMILLNLPSVVKRASTLVLGQTRGRISMGRLRGLELPIAPIAQQRKFDRVIDAHESMRERFVNAAAAVDLLFSSLQHRAFSGQL